MSLSQPTWTRPLPTRTVLALATLGPVGRRLPAPGTWGSAAGLLYFVVVLNPFSGASVPADILKNLAFGALGACLAAAICGEAELRLGRTDPGEVILDECVAMPLCFLGWSAPMSPSWQAVLCLAGFALFRLFDITKPFGIRRIQDIPGGWGVVLDDTAAALATCLSLHAALWIWLRVA